MGKDNIDSGMTVGLQEELLADLTLELEDLDNFQPKALLQKVVGAIREVKTARNYPSHYSDIQIERDLYHFYPTITTRLGLNSRKAMGKIRFLGHGAKERNCLTACCR